MGAHLAAVQLDHALHERQAEPKSTTTPVEAAVGLRERLEQPLERVGVDAHARVGDLEHRATLARASDTETFPSSGVNFAALLRRFPSTWASRVGSPSIQMASLGNSTATSCSSRSERWSSTVRRTTSTRSMRVRWRRILPRVMRVTSSRSSTRRDEVAHLPVDDRSALGVPARRPASPGRGCRGCCGLA